MNGHEDIVRLLIEKGADVNARVAITRILSEHMAHFRASREKRRLSLSVELAVGIPERDDVKKIMHVMTMTTMTATLLLIVVCAMVTLRTVMKSCRTGRKMKTRRMRRRTWRRTRKRKRKRKRTRKKASKRVATITV
ncbi:hypothetical protein BDD12DRAFT_831785 [Trichophaea hybrida]|nr:hypothetical protein BDD12DRAFT_831785 [Trichophaea hybrida]